MFPVLFNFPPVFNNLFSLSFLDTLLYTFFPFYFCWCCWELDCRREDMARRKTHIIDRDCGHRGEENQLCTMCCLPVSCIAVRCPSGDQQTHKSLRQYPCLSLSPVSISHFCLSFDIHSDSPSPSLPTYLFPSCQPVLSGHCALWAEFQELEFQPVRNKTNLLLTGEK